ncbi:hypothetical protein NSA24_12275 [Clostridioides mangenotii]|uniref:hypothetical protein n=1 Tax=Metaclostridioides mangenotii TaxID=1540 RepID=UPI00214A0375|nr:hypothetical protein [Clostridioides mangenotii]MCR1955572.1 hypothetical protein [Clostridioides mangenotii]
MFRQIPCEHGEHEFTRIRSVESEQVGYHKIEKHYDIYTCKICGCTFKIIVNEKTKIN